MANADSTATHTITATTKMTPDAITSIAADAFRRKSYVFHGKWSNGY